MKEKRHSPQANARTSVTPWPHPLQKLAIEVEITMGTYAQALDLDASDVGLVYSLYPGWSFTGNGHTGFQLDMSPLPRPAGSHSPPPEIESSSAQMPFVTPRALPTAKASYGSGGNHGYLSPSSSFQCGTCEVPCIPGVLWQVTGIPDFNQICHLGPGLPDLTLSQALFSCL